MARVISDQLISGRRTADGGGRRTGQTTDDSGQKSEVRTAKAKPGKVMELAVVRSNCRYFLEGSLLQSTLISSRMNLANGRMFCSADAASEASR